MDLIPAKGEVRAARPEGRRARGQGHTTGRGEAPLGAPRAADCVLARSREGATPSGGGREGVGLRLRERNVLFVESVVDRARLLQEYLKRLRPGPQAPPAGSGGLLPNLGPLRPA